MKNKLTFALLFAGLFLSKHVYSAGECLGYAGSIVQYLEFQGGSCPTVTSLPQSGVDCELVRTSDFICAISGSTGGGPWRYTGNPFGGETNPDPDPQPSPVITQPESVVVPSDLPTNNALTQFSYKMSAALGTLATNQWNLRAQANLDKHDILRVIGQYNVQSFDRDISTRDSIESFRTLSVSSFSAVEQSLDEKATENKELHEKTHAAQDVAQESLDKLPQLEIAVENARYHAQNASGAADSANYNAQQAYNMASEAAYNSGYIMGDVSDTKNMTSEMLNLMLEGGTGGSGDFEQTNDILNGIKSDANNNTDRIVNAVNNPTGLVTVTNELQAVGGKLDGLLGQGQGLSNQLGQQLNDIKTAVENIETGGGTGGPATDSGTHERLDTLNTKVSQLNESVVDSALNTQQVIDGSTDELLAELVAIKDALENGSSEYDDTEINEKLTALINNTGATGNNVVTSAQATQQAVAASGQQVTDAVNALGNAFEAGSGQNTGPTLCTGDDCYKGKSWVTPKYPEGMTSIYETHKAAFQDSSVHDYLKGFNPIISGNAPTSWQFCIDVGFANLGCHSLELPPYILSFVRLIILITAGFLCRRLIFGG